MYTRADYDLYQDIEHLAFALRVRVEHGAPVNFALASLHEDLARWLGSRTRHYLTGLDLRERALAALEGGTG